MINYPLVDIIIINWNGYEDTKECLDSIEKITYDNYRVVLVDNNSSCQSYKRLKDDVECANKYSYPIKILRLDSNLGFAGGNNYGIKYALDNGADYVCLLNNDTVIKSNCISELVNTARNNKNVGIVGGVIRYYNKREKIWFSGGSIKALSIKGIRAKHLKKLPSKKITYTKFVTGCLQLISKEVIEKNGFLPEGYFIYYEDADYCTTILRHGYKLLINRDAVIYHKCGGTASYHSPTSIYYSNRNRYIYINKFYNGWLRNFLILQQTILLYFKKIVYRGNNKSAILKVLKEVEK